MTASIALPAPLADYFGRTDGSDLLPLFAPDAVVRDEGETHQGTAAIAGWLQGVESRYRPRYRILASDQRGEAIVVTFEVSGTFPGSPATLRQAITLSGDRIARIETL